MGMFAAFAVIFLAPAFAFAEGGMSEQSFETILMLICVATVAFLGTHFVTDWLQREHGIVTGVEYLVLGAIMSPAFTELTNVPWANLLTTAELTQVSPALVLGEGCLGLLAGVFLDFRARDGISRNTAGVGLVLTIATLLTVTLVPFSVAAYVVGFEGALAYMPHLLCFGAVASVANSAHLRSLITFLDARGDGAQVVTRIARTSSLFALIAFGIIFCLFKPASDLFPGFDYGPAVDVMFWFGVHLVFGLLLGIVFALFLHPDMADEKILTIVIGMVIFTSGIGYFLKLSPIVVCFFLGVVLANASPPDGLRVRNMLLSIQQPLYIVIYFFVGAMMPEGVPWWAWAIAIPYLILRRLGRGLGGVLARGVAPELRQLPPIGSAMLAPGALSGAMLLNFQEVYAGQPMVEETYAALMLAIILSEPIAYRASRLWLIDATDVALTRDGGTA